MRRKQMRFIALLLALVLLCSGCSLPGTGRLMQRIRYQGSDVYPYEKMEYVRPDMAEYGQKLSACCDLAQSAETAAELMEAVYDFYDAYDAFDTGYSLAMLRFHGDMSDRNWEQEYEFCMEVYPQVQAGLDQLLHALAASPLRGELETEEYYGPDFFADYEGESIWDDAYKELVEQEMALESRYYALSGQALEAADMDEYYNVYGRQMAELFVELVKLRQQIALRAGFENYADYAYACYYGRTYTPADTVAYLAQIQRELVPLYRQYHTGYRQDTAWDICTEEETYGYLRDAAAKMGEPAGEAFYVLDRGGLYDLAYSENKFNSSYEVYLDSYDEPFIFMNPTGTAYDKLALAHEFGHFTNEYLCWGPYAGVDVSEVMSQSMEYLSLCYGNDTAELTKLKLGDTLCTYVEQAAYASFEHHIYDVPPQLLTTETVYGLYEQIGREFGFDSWQWDPRDFVDVTHFFTDPMYIISYVVSCDVAFQIYQLERESEGAGLAKYNGFVSSEASDLLQFVQDHGLDSPFDAKRIPAVHSTLDTYLFS